MTFAAGKTTLSRVLIPAGKSARVTADGAPGVVVAVDVLGPRGWQEVARLAGAGVGGVPGSDHASFVRARVIAAAAVDSVVLIEAV